MILANLISIKNNIDTFDAPKKTYKKFINTFNKDKQI